jgi:hypothetical protein
VLQMPAASVIEPRNGVEEDARSLHAMLAAESDQCTAAGMAALLSAVGPRCARVTVTAVREPDCLFTLWAPMSGVVTPQQMREQALRRACVAARQAVSLISPQLPAQHCVAAGWRDVLERALGGACDLLVVAAPPSRRRDRRLLRRACRSGGERILVLF